MGRFEQRVALVTAAAGGLGLGIARRLASEGAQVYIWDRDEEALTRLAGDAHQRTLDMRPQLLDMTDGEAIAEAVGALLSEAGRIDVLVNNVGGSLHTPYRFLDQTEDHWQRVMVLNLIAGVRTTRAVLPHLVERRYGRIVNLGSKAGRYGSLFAGANYVAAKGAVQALTQQLAREFGPAGITCNTVCPGAVLTERVRDLLAERQSEAERARVLESIPMRRHGSVADVAAAVAYLASEEAGFVTGATLDINGGQAMSV